ncbi:M23 family metallopeptidase [Streptomyces yangpuensis]|uniref:M23 family metallopeptidase n=1 Tax=Streptomyces yangpuensis TaxID=1648182 RepID=UPI0035D6FEA8
MTTLLLSLLLALSQAALAAQPPLPSLPSRPALPAVRPLPAPLSVARWWDPPPTPYAAGHRGVDLAAPVGAELRAVAAGRVHHAGQVAGRGVLSLALPNGLRTTYEPVRPLVTEGEEVSAGQVVAVLTEGSHCPGPCLHWGLLAGEAYLNPLTLLARPTPRLLPDPGPAGAPEGAAAGGDAGLSPGPPAGRWPGPSP